MQRWKIGDVTITRIVEVEAPGLVFVLPDATPENLRQIEWLAPHFITEDGDALASVHALVIESAGRRIVVDTCIGNDKDLPRKSWARRQGPFLSDLTKAGFEREAIDTVICTHLHVDHVGWNTMLVDGRWVPTFPNARYLFGRVEWDHWGSTAEDWISTVMTESVRPIIESGLHQLVESDHRINDEIWLEPTPGHTPGHVSVRISSKGSEAVITGDLMHHPSQIVRTEWAANPDVDPQTARITRREFIRRYAGSGVLVIGTHFATPTAGFIVPDGDSFRFEVA